MQRLFWLRNIEAQRQLGQTCAYTCFAASQSTWSIQSMYRLGCVQEDWRCPAWTFISIYLLSIHLSAAIVTLLASWRTVVLCLHTAAGHWGGAQAHRGTLRSVT
jgi:hypothetical protein